MRADPEPNHRLLFHDSQGAPIPVDPHRIDGQCRVDFLEAQGGDVPGCEPRADTRFRPSLESQRALPRAVCGTPRLCATARLYRGLVRPALYSLKASWASLASWSCDFAKESAQRCSDVSSSSRMAATASCSEGGSFATSCMAFSRSLVMAKV